MLNKALLISTIILVINFFFQININLSLIKIKNVDKYILNYMSYSFDNISKFNIQKYFLNNSKKNMNNQNNTKKVINIYFVNYFKTFRQNAIINSLLIILKKKYIIKINKNNPDYLFYNVNYCKHLYIRYKKSIKIAFYLENQIPDFNNADYAIGQSHIIFFDRYFKCPYFLLFNIKNNIFKNLREKVLNSPIRKKFCAAVISNTHSSDNFRLDFIKELNKYKQVDMGGKYNNNIGKVSNKIKFLSSYKFSIAMENSEGDGYISEKILDSLLSGTIPIYYGDYMVDEYINPKSYILIRGKNDMNQKIELIKKLNENDKLYKKFIKVNIFNDDNYNIKINQEKLQFIYNIFEQDINKAKRIDNYHFK